MKWDVDRVCSWFFSRWHIRCAAHQKVDGVGGDQDPTDAVSLGNPLANSELRANRSRALTYRLVGGPRPGGGPAQRSRCGALKEASWKTSRGFSRLVVTWVSAAGAAPVKHRTQCQPLLACAVPPLSESAGATCVPPSAEQICPMGQLVSACAIAGEITAATSDKTSHTSTPKLSLRAVRNWWNGWRAMGWSEVARV